MKAIICGGGQVGSSIARELAAERVNVTVIDQSPDLIQRIRDTLDVTAMVGFASHPDVLEAAGARVVERRRIVLVARRHARAPPHALGDHRLVAVQAAHV